MLQVLCHLRATKVSQRKIIASRVCTGMMWSGGRSISWPKLETETSHEIRKRHCLSLSFIHILNVASIAAHVNLSVINMCGVDGPEITKFIE